VPWQSRTLITSNLFAAADVSFGSIASLWERPVVAQSGR
jgi:hypothetical protein